MARPPQHAPADTPPGLPADTALTGKALSVSRHCNACRVCFLGYSRAQTGGSSHPPWSARCCAVPVSGKHVPAAGFLHKRFPFRHLAHQHFFQRHGLCTELQTVGIVYLAAAMLIFHGHGCHRPRRPCNDTPFGSCETLPTSQSPVSFKRWLTTLIPRAISKSPRFSVRVTSWRVCCRRPSAVRWFSPLLFQCVECPLTAAKAEMLDTGHQQVIIWGNHYDNLSRYPRRKIFIHGHHIVMVAARKVIFSTCVCDMNCVKSL